MKLAACTCTSSAQESPDVWLVSSRTGQPRQTQSDRGLPTIRKLRKALFRNFFTAKGCKPTLHFEFNDQPSAVVSFGHSGVHCNLKLHVVMGWTNPFTVDKKEGSHLDPHHHGTILYQSARCIGRLRGSVAGGMLPGHEKPFPGVDIPNMHSCKQVAHHVMLCRLRGICQQELTKLLAHQKLTFWTD